ncbi:aminotransferase class I/II-fold pyridoxal phosphate-dependent enzyme [Pararhodospirillum oryzae]|uniref:aminotransferase class I/II-fold pyridoxal phosphate-dependent enzyme n=1 Tax=Pararhodospirillum oryzae TaxID=478448 RepID=UPI001FE76DED|nr:aminotransferase class I/II-fold pyridoxal phosphate-dependent enzyme [Pararhodospirillum oryzae]
MSEKAGLFSNLSAEEKRRLLERMLREKDKKREKDSTTLESAFEFPPEYAGYRKKLETTGEEGVGDLFYRSFEGVNTRHALIDGVKAINFCSYNYLDLSGDERVGAAAKAAIETDGTSVSASRLVSGERPVHAALESALARWIGVDAALAFVGGYGTNEDVIGHLMGAGDLILYDSLIHASVQQGARLSGATVIPFPHNNPQALESILQRRRAQARHALIVVEGVYSMDGDIPDLPALVEIKQRHQALLMVDEAHSMGVIGATGKGLSQYAGVPPRSVDLWMGTLSKTFASCGGYIAGSQDMVSYLRHTAPGFVFSVGLAPPLAAAALAALQILEEQPQRVAVLHARALLFHTLARTAGLDVGVASPESAIVPIMVGESEKAARLSRALLKKGVLALPIGFPAVPENKARLRFFLSSAHTEEDIRSAVKALAAESAA